MNQSNHLICTECTKELKQDYMYIRGKKYHTECGRKILNEIVDAKKPNIFCCCF